MKSIVSIVLGLAVLAPQSFARRGGENTDILQRGTAAWFASESAEHVARALVANGTITEAGLTALSVDLTSATAAQVQLTTNVGAVAKACQMVTESSRRGTVIKKDVRCDGLAESRLDLTRGSDAWAVIEGLEHSLRLAVTADASVLASIAGASSALQGDQSVLVQFELSNGSLLNYACARQYYGQFNAFSLNCAAVN